MEQSETGAGVPAQIADLLARIPELEARVRHLEQERDEYRTLYLLAREEIAQLKRGLVGQKAQRVPENDAQLSLAILDLLLGEGPRTDAATSTQMVATHSRQKPIRKPLPEHLPRVSVEVLPPEVEREGLDALR